MRRLLATAGVAALGLAVVLPVAAQAAMPDSTHKLAYYQPVTYDRMTGNPTNLPATAPDGAAVFSTDEVVTVKADFGGDGVTGWTVVLRPVGGGTPSSCHEDIAPRSNGLYPSVVYVNCPWDTTRAVDRTHQATNTDPVDTQTYDRNWHLNDHGPSVNGKYSIEVTVTNSGTPDGILTKGIPGGQQFTLYEDPSGPRWRQVWVNNDVAAPSGVNATFDPASARINVTWAPNPEPDVTYLVQEKVGDGKWGNPVTVPGTATNYVRAVDQPGKYQYQVAAQRPGPTADTGKNATATKTSAYVASSVVGIAQVSPPTTAGGANGADGNIDHSGDNGVVMPTDPTTGRSAPGAGPAKSGPTAGPARPGATAGGSRTVGSTARPNGSSAAGGGGEAEGEGPDGGFSSTLPFNTSADGSADGLGNG
ncbi:MAG TPA: hypothetical protein VGP90_00725, partial [Acidimicrobiia bacterium]|nr:hypothetical protein [Acidimicrobiia bacterium]